VNANVVPLNRKLLIAVTVTVTVALAVLAAGAPIARADPPIATIGPVTAPNDTATTTGTVESGGDTDACVNDQHSGADPSSSNPDTAVQVNDVSCQPASGGQPANSQTSGSQPSSGAASGSSSGSSTSTGSTPSGGSKPAGSSSASGTAKKAATTIAAANARGLKISAIGYLTKGIRSSKKLGVRVTLRDADGNLIRDAIVSIKGVPGSKNTIDCAHAAYTNSAGVAAFTVPVSAKLLGKRLVLGVVARTPSRRVSRIGAVRLP
jgi:hypothetical protein